MYKENDGSVYGGFYKKEQINSNQTKFFFNHNLKLRNNLNRGDFSLPTSPHKNSYT